MMAKLWMRAAAAIALVLLAGCTPSGPTTAPPPTATAGLGDRDDPRSPAPSAAVTREITASYDFVTPSKNIGCFMSPEAARCDIAEKKWKAPAKPADCDLDWGNGVSVGADGEATIVCAGDTVMGASQTLPYGEAVRVGDFVCTSAQTGVRCTNEPTGHGFMLSRQSYDLF
jgi:enamine deaminase RidA (YjgF/YER057c/UK114 family)